MVKTNQLCFNQSNSLHYKRGMTRGPCQNAIFLDGKFSANLAHSQSFFTSKIIRYTQTNHVRPGVPGLRIRRGVVLLQYHALCMTC